MSPVTDAWQQARAAEHQAAFGYALLGPRLPPAQQALAVACSDAHERLRDATAAALTDLGQAPIAPDADYPSLYPVPNPATARRLAVRLEDDCAVAWRFLYLQAASSGGPSARRARRAAQDALTASAVRAARWRTLVTPADPTPAFPGL